MTPVETPHWKLRMDPDLRRAGIVVANAQGDDLSSVVRSAVRAYIADPNAFNAAIATIRGLAAVHAAPTSEPTP